MFKAVKTDSAATTVGENSRISREISSCTSCNAAPSDSLRRAVGTRSAPQCSKVQWRPSLSIIPYPVGPAAAGSKPRTRMQTAFLIATLMVVIGRIVYGVLDVAARGLSAELCGCRNEMLDESGQTVISWRQQPLESPTHRYRNWRRRAARRRVLRALPPGAPFAWPAARSA